MAATDAIPVPRKNTAYRFYFAIRKPSDSTLITTWAGADSEVSLDGAAYSDCTNEATEIGTTGTGYIDLTSSEMNADCVLLKVTVTNTGSVPLVFALYPESAGDYRVADTQKVDVDTIKTNPVVNGGTITFPTGATLASTTNITAATGVVLSGVTHTGAVIPTVTTLTGHTPQTGDTYALANGAAGFVAIDTVVDAILDDTGTTGVLLSTTALGAIWNRLTSSLTTVGSIGKWILDNLTGDIYARLGAPTGASVSADIAAVPTAAQNAAAVEAAILNEGDATALLAAIAAKVEEFLINEGDATATIAAIATACNAAIAAGTVGTNAATAATQASSANTKLGTPAGDSVSADIVAVKADTAAILLDTGTDGVVVATASKTGYALSSAGVRSIWTDDWFEIEFLNTTPGGYLQALDTANDTTSASLSAIDLWVKRNAVILSGLVTGAGTGTEVFTISTLSITATVTVDGDGNRSALVWS